MQFGFAYAPPLIIGAAVANRVFDTLASGAKNVEEVSRQTGASVRGLRVIMNALAGLELLKKGGDKHHHGAKKDEHHEGEGESGGSGWRRRPALPLTLRLRVHGVSRPRSALPTRAKSPRLNGS